MRPLGWRLNLSKWFSLQERKDHGSELDRDRAYSMHEETGCFVMIFNLVGFIQDDISVAVRGEKLVITALKSRAVSTSFKSLESGAALDLFLNVDEELNHSDVSTLFYRSIPLKDEIDRERISYLYEDHQLKVWLPRM